MTSAPERKDKDDSEVGSRAKRAGDELPSDRPWKRYRPTPDKAYSLREIAEIKKSLVELLDLDYSEAIVAKKVMSGLRQFENVFSEEELCHFEAEVDALVEQAQRGELKEASVDVAPLRTKLFLGLGYTYGGGLNSERVRPAESVSPIPDFVKKIEARLIEKGIVAADFSNSCVINDYKPNGCIAPHKDPYQIFARPIVSLSLCSDGCLSFGSAWTFNPIRCGKPVFRLGMPRGVVTIMEGYAADDVTHCVRPQDTVARRVSIILRRVRDEAPRASAAELERAKSTLQQRRDTAALAGAGSGGPSLAAAASAGEQQVQPPAKS